LSVFAGGLQALVRERLRSGFRSSSQLAATVGAETLGVLPKVRDLRFSLRFDDRDSAFSEAVYSIRAMLRQQARHGLAQVVMVTSAIPKEGKTFFSSALARNAAVAGERVVLIDCDVRRPAVARNIVGNATHSLEDVVIRQDSHSPLHIIALTPGPRSPHDLFASAAMRKMIAMLRLHYDLILLDTPPVLAVSDARVLANVSDVTILVVRWETTPQNLVSSAVKALRSSGAVLAGSVINQVKLGSMDPGDDAQAYVYSTYAGED
jgi:capsular exopolysaccharide synthesis family protein